ncbi:MAG TPA: hypothetical protein VLH13_05205 [Methanomassiliicoccales archaeon]|nr:hypothetical protein [Methanomassiliicoccales archaeon]
MAAAIFLPIPVELALMISPITPMVVKAVVLGLGKMVGSVAVFYIGFELGGPIRRWSEKIWIFAKFVEFCEWFVKKFKHLGLFILLCVPFMSDTVLIYIFSLFNKEGKTLNVVWFALANLGGGIVRAVIYIEFGCVLGLW